LVKSESSVNSRFGMIKELPEFWNLVTVLKVVNMNGFRELLAGPHVHISQTLISQHNKKKDKAEARASFVSEYNHDKLQSSFM
jgi:hypothetical protein